MEKVVENNLGLSVEEIGATPSPARSRICALRPRCLAWTGQTELKIAYASAGDTSLVGVIGPYGLSRQPIRG